MGIMRISGDIARNDTNRGTRYAVVGHDSEHNANGQWTLETGYLTRAFHTETFVAETLAHYATDADAQRYSDLWTGVNTYRHEHIYPAISEHGYGRLSPWDK